MSGYLTTNEAARVFDVSLRTVQLWFDSGVLPGHRTHGKHRRIPIFAVIDMARQMGISVNLDDLEGADKRPGPERMAAALHNVVTEYTHILQVRGIDPGSMPALSRASNLMTAFTAAGARSIAKRLPS